MGLAKFLLVSSFALTSAPQPSQTKVSASVVDVLLPLVVDERNSVKFEIKAQFPSSCFQLSPAAVRLDSDRNVVLFHASAIEFKGKCAIEPTALTQIVDVGRLPEGNYEVRELKNLKKWGRFSVQHIETSADASTQLPTGRPQ